MKCEDIGRLLPFYVCDEVEAEVTEAIERHTAQCPACAGTLAGEKRLADAVAAAAADCNFEDRSAPAAQLLAQCRDALQEALDKAEAPNIWKRLRGWISPAQWLTAQPALGAAFLLLGVVIGVGAPQLLESPDPTGESGPPAVTVQGTPLGGQNSGSLNVSDIRGLNPDEGNPTSTYEVEFNEKHPIILRGTMNDDRLRGVLLNVLQNSQRFDSGLRLESVEALKNRGDDLLVRKTLCESARKDRNPGVRLKAMEALRPFGEDDTVRDALIEILLRDSNPGVRIEAITALRAMAENSVALPKLQGDARLHTVLRDLMQKDPNTNIRVQSAAAMRQIGSRQAH